MEFVGREKELDELKKVYESDKSEFIIIYGRRRLGKTTLIKESLPKNSVYFLLTKEKSLINLQNFKEVMSQINPILKDIEADSWESYFRKASNLIPEKTIIVFDEFPYLTSDDKSVESQIQKIYDEYLKPKKIKLVLCGSSMSVMTNIQEYKSPLYGRRTFSLNLKPFSLKESFEFLKDMKDDLKIKVHLICGGVPYYLEQFKFVKTKEDLKNKLLNEFGIFSDEAYFLLKEDFREISNYFSILRFIAQGKNTFSEISDASLIEKGSLSKYLQSLELLNYIKNEKSFFSKQNSKKTRYIMTDNFLYVWFKLIYKQITKQKFDFESIFGFLFELEVKRILSKNYEVVSPYFKEGVEIDILVKKDNKIICIECKFNEKDKDDVLKKLKNKISTLPKEFNYEPIVVNLKNLDFLLENKNF
jgi:uncharacterized protein